MNYLDKVRKDIARSCGLTGVEAGHIVKRLQKKGIDEQTIDWRTIGQDMYGKAHSVGNVEKQIHSMYNLDIGNMSDQDSSYFLQQEVHLRQSRRSPAQQSMDNRINARHRFKITNEKGVRKWLKHPNKYDILDVDDVIRF